MIAFLQHRISIAILRSLCLLSGGLITGLLGYKLFCMDGWEAKKETIIYSLPLVPLFFVWVQYKIADKSVFKLDLLLLDGIVVGLAASRILGLFFHSGHVLFLAYTYFTAANRFYRFLCIPIVLITVCYKVMWMDMLSPAIAAVMASWFIQHYKNTSIQLNHRYSNESIHHK